MGVTVLVGVPYAVLQRTCLTGLIPACLAVKLCLCTSKVMSVPWPLGRQKFVKTVCEEHGWFQWCKMQLLKCGVSGKFLFRFFKHYCGIGLIS